jgi:hypothetical protein
MINLIEKQRLSKVKWASFEINQMFKFKINMSKNLYS